MEANNILTYLAQPSEESYGFYTQILATLVGTTIYWLHTKVQESQQPWIHVEVTADQV